MTNQEKEKIINDMKWLVQYFITAATKSKRIDCSSHYEDMWQEAYLYMVKKLPEYDENKGRLDTYLGRGILGAVKKYIFKMCYSMHIKNSFADEIYRMYNAMTELEKNHEAVTIDNLAKTSGLSKQELKHIYAVMAPPEELEDSLPEERPKLNKKNYTIPCSELDIENDIEKILISEQIRGILRDNLDDRELRVITMYYGIDTERSSQDRIAAVLGMSQMTVGRAIRTILKKLEDPFRKAGLDVYSIQQ